MNRFFKDSLSIIRNYKWNSIFFRYFKILVLVIILPALIFIAITLNFYLSSIKSDIASSQRYNIIKSITQFDKAFDTIDNITDNIIASPLTANIVSPKLQSDYSYNEYTAFLNKQKRNCPYINSISVYNPKNGYVISTYGSSDISQFRDTSWLTLYNHGNVIFMISASPHNVDNSSMINIGANLLVNDRNAGLIIFTVDGSVLCDQMYAGNINNGETVLLFNDDDELIYSSSYEPFEYNSDGILKMLENTTYREESSLSTNQYIYNSIASENHKFKIVSALSMSSHKKNYTRIAFIMAVYFLLTILMVIIFSLFGAFSFYRSIVDILIKTSAINSDAGINTANENNELMYLSDTLFNTVKNHQQIENELVEKISKLKKVQSIALQTQINPHFLFNSLNLVNGFILEECHGDSKAATMLSNISDILYIALNTKEYIVSVETELEYAKKYLAVELIKYPDKFKVEYNIDPETLDCKTVKFVLQPIIENAIEHGMKYLSGKNGLIRISTAIMNNMLILSVCDNGPKIPDEKLAELERNLASDEIQETKHIGLSNVNQRIKLIFGEEYGVSVYSDEDKTTVDIIMPIK